MSIAHAEWQMRIARMRADDAAHQAWLSREVRALRRREAVADLWAAAKPTIRFVVWLLVLGRLADVALEGVLRALGGPAA